MAWLLAKKGILSCELPIGDAKMMQLQKVTYLDRVRREDGKCDSEIWRCMQIGKDDFQQLSKLLREKQISLERKKIMLDCGKTSNRNERNEWV